MDKNKKDISNSKNSKEQQHSFLFGYGNISSSSTTIITDNINGNSLQRKNSFRIHLQQLWTQMLEYVLTIRHQSNHHLYHHHQHQHHYHNQHHHYHYSSQLYQVSLATILNEFAQLKIQYEQIVKKCERLELQLEQANCRAEFLAQEVDEQHLRLENASEKKLAMLEKKYHDQIRLIEMDFSREKEIMIIQSYHLRQDIDRQMNDVQEQLSKFRTNIKLLEEENKRLEMDCQQMKCQNHELVQNFIDIQRHVEESDNLNAKIAIENAQDRKNLEQITNEMEKLKEQNKRLQDQNDELLIEKESLRQQLATLILASYQQQQQQQHSTMITSTETTATTTVTTNQSSIHHPKSSTLPLLSSSLKPESIILASTEKIMTMVESGKLPITGFPSSSSSVSINERSKKRKRRRRRKKNKNKINNNNNPKNEKNDIINEVNDNETKLSDNNNIVNVSSTLPSSSTSTSLILKKSEKNHKNNSLSKRINIDSISIQSEDDQSSTITTHGDDFDDDDVDYDDEIYLIDDDFDDFCHHQETLLSSWTLQQKQRRKRIKHPELLLDDTEKIGINDDEKNNDDENEDDEDDVDDDDDFDDDNTQTLIIEHRNNQYTRSLSDEINFDNSGRPIFATNNQLNNSKFLEDNLKTILNQIILNDDDNNDNANINYDDNNETILNNALNRIQNALNKIRKNKQQKSILKENASTFKYPPNASFDHNNNPDLKSSSSSFSS